MSTLPKIIEEVGFDFHWSEEKVWKLDVPVESMDIEALLWHCDIPFWSTPQGHYDLTPLQVIENPERYPQEYARIMNAELQYPLDIMWWKNRWLLLDGLHRLVKAKLLRQKTVQVRKIPVVMIPQIRK